MTAMAPSPTAEATRPADSALASPATKTPGTLVSRWYGIWSRVHSCSARASCVPGAVPALCHRRGGLRQVIELGEPRCSRHQPRHLAERQRLAVRAHMPQETRDIAGCQQALCLLKLFSHTQTLAKRLRPQLRSAAGG